MAELGTVDEHRLAVLKQYLKSVKDHNETDNRVKKSEHHY